MTAFTIQWLQGLAGAADDFDEDHWRLLDKVNTLLQAISSANETGVLMACSGLRVAAQEHFAREEVQMRALQYPETEQHCESHRRLLDSLSSLQFMLRNMDGFTHRDTEGLVSTTGLFADAQLALYTRLGSHYIAGVRGVRRSDNLSGPLGTTGGKIFAGPYHRRGGVATPPTKSG